MKNSGRRSATAGAGTNGSVSHWHRGQYGQATNGDESPRAGAGLDRAAASRAPGKAAVHVGGHGARGQERARTRAVGASSEQRGKEHGRLRDRPCCCWRVEGGREAGSQPLHPLETETRGQERD